MEDPLCGDPRVEEDGEDTVDCLGELEESEVPPPRPPLSRLCVL